MLVTKSANRFPTIEPIVTLPPRLRRLLADPFAEMLAAPPLGWMPPVEIVEQGDAYVLRAELPGMTKDDVELALHHNVLTLRGEKKEEFKKDGEEYLCYERPFGTFTRSFTLPTNVVAEKVLAKFDRGILEIILPKTMEAQDKVIPIRE